MKAYQKIAVDFASALSEKKFDVAHQFLAEELQDEYSPDSLKEEMFEMFDVYEWNTEPHSIEFDQSSGSMEEWPDKIENDIGWAYVGIIGDSAVEAVAVIVTETSEGLKIRSIEWGRP